MNVASQKYCAPVAAQRLVAGYVRCSTDMQAETSPAQQKNLILEFAEKHNCRIVEWFIDVGKSGTSFEKRPEFSRLKSTIESRPAFSAVIALDESRWGRAGAEDSIYYKRHFKKVADVDVLMVRTIAKTGNSTFDVMLGAFEGGLSREESVKKSERTYDGCLSAVKHGHSAGGTAPYGYRRAAINRFTKEKRILSLLHDKEGQVVLNDKGLPISEQTRPKEEYTVWEPGDPAEVAVVRRIFDLRVRLGYGYAKIARILNAEGVRCPQRGRWSNRNQKWAFNSVRTIIANPVYRGARVYDRQKKKGIGKYAPRYWQNDQTKWTIIENAHEPIVSAEEWKLANPVPENSERGRLSKKRFDSPYLLSGLLKCSHCGFNFHGRAQRTGRPGRRKKRKTYMDSGYTSKGPTVCSFISIDAVRLENALLKEIKKRILSSTIVETVKKVIEAYIGHRSQNNGNETEKIDKEIFDISNRINSLIAIAELGIRLNEISDRLQALQEKKSDLESSKQNCLISRSSQDYDQNIAKKVVMFFNEFEKRFEDAPISEQKVLITQMVDQIIIDREKRIAKCYLLKIPRQQLVYLEGKKAFSGTSVLSVPPTRFELVFQA